MEEGTHRGYHPVWFSKGGGLAEYYRKKPARKESLRRNVSCACSWCSPGFSCREGRGGGRGIRGEPLNFGAKNDEVLRAVSRKGESKLGREKDKPV